MEMGMIVMERATAELEQETVWDQKVADVPSNDVLGFFHANSVTRTNEASRRNSVHIGF
jgi:hypothetical protein